MSFITRSGSKLPNSNNIIYNTSNNTNGVWVDISYNNIFERECSVPEEGTCSACGNKKLLVYEYGTANIKRQICEFCYINYMDKKFGINSDSKVLETLYKKED